MMMMTLLILIITAKAHQDENTMNNDSLCLSGEVKPLSEGTFSSDIEFVNCDIDRPYCTVLLPVERVESILYKCSEALQFKTTCKGSGDCYGFTHGKKDFIECCCLNYICQLQRTPDPLLTHMKLIINEEYKSISSFQPHLTSKSTKEKRRTDHIGNYLGISIIIFSVTGVIALLSYSYYRNVIEKRRKNKRKAAKEAKTDIVNAGGKTETIEKTSENTKEKAM